MSFRSSSRWLAARRLHALLALGGVYGAKPIGDAAFALDELEPFCRECDVDAWLDRPPD
jgi:hypothetical protein